jgi:putative hydrolase of HD superfamily
MSSLDVFLTELMRLKALPRTGWLLRGVRDVESIADHSFGVAFISMLLADRALEQGLKVNTELVLRMALLHDIAEVRTGDLPNTVKPYFPGNSLAEANDRAADDVFAALGHTAEAYKRIREEYEARESLESRIVKAADKLDLLFQAKEYQKGGAQNLKEFFENAAEDFQKLGLDGLIADILRGLEN